MWRVFEFFEDFRRQKNEMNANANDDNNAPSVKTIKHCNRMSLRRTTNERKTQTDEDEEETRKENSSDK